ncbi:alpha/beta hydrolase [Streptomyces sp. DSM 44915]|uniref:Alpha/beta hydrolase n=1 Tax=Streptomyces chisholmiae TaxID=3075540 RepID=A0ABU2JRY5_9ACTN|nr:alpha/beta hydrolase [Streptomyces sp. DSM 44915]MDT0266993.1 alpha/beta hydrolase [Streptomyces sp. DSM 44915]
MSALRLHVGRIDGPAERTLLVIHGGPDWDHGYLLDPLRRLAGRRRVLLPDLRGCGRSPGGLAPERYTPDAAVGDLLALLAALDVARVDVLGFSYGGLLAQRLALAAPERVRRLVIASSTVLPVPADAYDDWPERAERRAPEARVWADPTLDGPALTRAAAVAGAPANVWRAAALPDYLARLARVRFTAEWLGPFRAGTLPPALPTDAAGRLAALGLPTLLLHGRQDMVFPAALAERAARRIPTARAVLLDEAGHMAHVDQPTAWLAAVTDHLR